MKKQTTTRLELQDEISVTVIAAGFEKTNSVDILNSPVIPATPVENAGSVEATTTEDVYRGTSPIDIPTFLKR